MIAYHGRADIKAHYLARVEAHRLADEIVQGIYWENGRGCALGCTIHTDLHSEYETQLGIPTILAFIQDAIFDNLPLVEAKAFPSAFLKAIPVGADLSLVWHKFAVWMLTDPAHGVICFATRDQTRTAVEVVAALHQRAIDGAMPTVEAWDAGRRLAAEAAGGREDDDAFAAVAAATAAADAYVGYANADAAGKIHWTASRDSCSTFYVMPRSKATHKHPSQSQALSTTSPQHLWLEHLQH